MRIQFTKTITVAGKAFAAGDECDSTEIGWGSLKSLFRQGQAIEITPAEMARRAEAERQAFEADRQAKAKANAELQKQAAAERDKLSKDLEQQAEQAAAERERQAEAEREQAEREMPHHPTRHETPKHRGGK